MVMALAGNKADLLDARKVSAEVNQIFLLLFCLILLCFRQKPLR